MLIEHALELFKLATEWMVILATFMLFVVTKYDIPQERAQALARKPVIGRFLRVTVTQTETVEAS